MSNVKDFNTFNESNTGDTKPDIIITMDDVRKMKHNLGYKRGVADIDSFLSNYSWTEDQLLLAKPGYGKPQVWDGKEVMVYDLYTQGAIAISGNFNNKTLRELGYAIAIDGTIQYLIGIYEPHGCSLNAKRGLVTTHGHEQIIKVWLDDGEFVYIFGMQLN